VTCAYSFVSLKEEGIFLHFDEVDVNFDVISISGNYLQCGGIRK
jgi:hypothetical protein